MKQGKLSIWMAGCLAVFWLLPAAGQSSARAELSNAAMLIGDQVTIRLHASFTDGSKVQGFDFSALDTVKNLEVIKVLPPVAATPGQIDQEVLITSFEEGEYTIPRLLFSSVYNGRVDSAYTDSLVLTVKTLPVSSDTIALQPIKDIIPEPKNWSDWAPFAGLGLGLLVFGLLMYYIFIKPRKALTIYQPRAPKLPPHEIALRQLMALRDDALWQKGELKAYYSRLTYILRQYLELRFQVKALESTSDEIVAASRHLPVGDETKAAISRLLYAADLVKFAKAIPAEDTHDHHWDSVHNFVLATQPVVVPEEGDAQKS